MKEVKIVIRKDRVDSVVHALEDAEPIVRSVREHAATGRRGDGMVAVTPLERVVSVRTGEDDLLAIV